ncbi:hypothetical protein CCP3SC5AM1_1930004 [Gammaproteobacteria bacterium]
MTKSLMDIKPLPLSFTQSFLSDRDLLARLLRFVAKNDRDNKEAIGSKEAISTATNIPTGKYTGKVEPMIRYAEGMGLVKAEKTAGEWHLTLTPLGRLISKQDAALSESVTLWLLHLLMSRRCGLTIPATGVADPWFVLFGEGAFRLGKRFTQADYLAVLRERHGNAAYLKGLSNLVLRGYSEPRAWGGIIALQTETRDKETIFIRQVAPCESAYFPAYAIYLYLLWDELFPKRLQLAFDEFSEQTRFLSLTGWENVQVAIWLDWLANHRIVQLDRHTGTPILLRLHATEQVLATLYDELI